MKYQLRMSLICLSAAAMPAYAQDAPPLCGTRNFDQARSIFTVMDPVPGSANQQCLLNVYRSGERPSQAAQSPASYLVEGRYLIDISGGGGGGGGGASKDHGGGGGGAGAAPIQVVKTLTPGVYKLTIGMGGMGGKADGGTTEYGSPSSLTNATTGELIAGFAGADTWKPLTRVAGGGLGGAADIGGSRGGDGGDVNRNLNDAAQSGGMLSVAGYSGRGGVAGSESGRSAQGDAGPVVQANAGGGGGASVGSGGSGGSISGDAVPGRGDLGGGGGGGRGGVNTADAGARGGHGFIKLTPN